MGTVLAFPGPKSSADGLHGCGQSHQAAGGLVPGSAPPTGPPGPSLWRTCVHTRPCPAQPRGRAAAPRWRGPWPPGLPPGSSTVTAPWNQTSLCPSLTPHRSGSVPSASGVTAKLAVTSERTRGVRLIMSVTSAHGLCKTAARLGPSWAKGTLRGGPWSSVQSCRLVPELPLGSPHTARHPRLLAAARYTGPSSLARGLCSPLSSGTSSWRPLAPQTGKAAGRCVFAPRVVLCTCYLGPRSISGTWLFAVDCELPSRPKPHPRLHGGSCSSCVRPPVPARVCCPPSVCARLCACARAEGPSPPARARLASAGAVPRRFCPLRWAPKENRLGLGGPVALKVPVKRISSVTCKGTWSCCF